MHTSLDPQASPVWPYPWTYVIDLVGSLAVLELKTENSRVQCDLLGFYLLALSLTGLIKGATFPT